jgi:Alpha-glutamyl/putrescinyl thymine pyrophosphorylase clade 3
MSEVKRFGRLAKFEYLTMLGKLGLAPLESPSAYLNGATGPLQGARLLFAGDRHAKLSAKTLDSYLIKLDEHVQVGMQVLEDALCNWQKSPDKFRPFRG